MKLKIQSIRKVLAFVMAFLPMASFSQVTMNIDASLRSANISPYQYGLFFEEINHAGDGGLYAELVSNRSFEDADTPVNWGTVTANQNQVVTTSLITNQLLNKAQGKALKFMVSSASEEKKAGVYNGGYWGMGFKNEETYTLTLWMRGRSSLNGKVFAQLQTEYGEAVSIETQLCGNFEGTFKWTKMTASLKATKDCVNGRLAILTGTNDVPIYMDVVSLMPATWKNRKNGCRPDLAELLAATRPSFLRFPGGCYVEGEGTYDNAFQWKKTIGPIECRQGHMNQNWKYRSSDGLGYDEYLQLCEDLGAAPMFVVNVGLGHGFTIPYEDVDTLVQNTLDAIEYANGDAATVWGAKRIANGHEAPYNLKFIEVGNENGQANVRDDYGRRYIKFYQAIKAKYPDITVIGNVEAWGTDNPSWALDYPVDMVDEHYYRSYTWMTNNYRKYDRYPRTIGVYNGEYAANASGTYGTYGNMNSALGEAIYMLGMEKNSDVCRLASFAPIFTHEKDPHWAYDMIHFNASSHFCTPSYYVQKLLGNGLGKQNLQWTETGNTTTDDKQLLYQSVQIDDEKGILYLKVVNPNADKRTLHLNLKNMSAVSASVVRLASAQGTDENTMDNPNHVVPTEEQAVADPLNLDIPAYSLNVYEIKVNNIAGAVSDGVTDEDADKYGYLYAHMSSDKEVTSFALSRYGIVYNDLLGSEEVFDTKAFTHTGGMRDAYVCRTESGKFMLAGTDMTSKLGWNSNHEMTLMLSNDLVHWDKSLSIDLESEENLKALGVSSGDDITAAWAPEIIYDPVTKNYVVYYSVGFKTNGHRIYYSLMNEDLTGFTKPRLYFDPGYDIIDADIVYNKLDNQYVMIYKTEYSTTNGGHKLLQATADHLVPTSGEETGTCQWVINPDFEVSETGKSIEAPSLFRPIGSRTWKLAYMNYSGGGYRMVDLDEHCLNPTNLINIKGNVKAQHGSFLTLAQREYEHLQTWANLKELLPQARSLNESHAQENLAQAIEQGNHALETSDTFDEEYQEMQAAYPALVEAMSQYREYLKELAAKGELSDLTALITNPDFSEGSVGWKGTSFTQATKGVAEHYNKTFNFYQELTDMPNGRYRLTAQVFYRAGSIDIAKAAHLDGSEVITPRMYINDESCEVNCLYDTDVYTFSPTYTYPDNVTQANEAFNANGLYECSLTAEVTDGIVRLGIKSDKMTSRDWCCFDNFRLEYLGVSDGIAFPTKEEKKIQNDIFDLQGRKFSKLPKLHGVYVMNGKKVIL